MCTVLAAGATINTVAAAEPRDPETIDLFPVVGVSDDGPRKRMPLERPLSARLFFWAGRVLRRPRPRFSFFDGIEQNPLVWGGAAVVSGTRIPVFAIWDTYRDERRLDRVLDAYPRLTEAEAMLALAFALTKPDIVQKDRAAYLAKLPPEYRQ